MFVSFEGLDGSGKTTQVQLLAEYLRETGREVVATREPGGTPVGERIRQLLLDGAEMSPWAEAALFAAARAELVETVIAPALDRGAHVVCDRYLDSSLAYQGVARGLGIDEVLELNGGPTGELLPDRTFLLLIDPELSARRVGAGTDRIEGAGADFRTRLQAGYEEVAARFPERIVTLDGSRSKTAIAEAVRQELAIVA